MICIWDNNEEYSAHCIHFTRMNDSVMSKAEFETLLPYTSIYYPVSGSGHAVDPPFVIAFADEKDLDWRVKDGFEEVWEAFKPDYFLKLVPGKDPKDYASYVQVKRTDAWNRSIIERLIPHWETMAEKMRADAQYYCWEEDDLEEVKRLMKENDQ